MTLDLKMQTIYIYCDGGFGNRYNSLIGGLQLAQWTGRAPKIIWNTNNWCGAAFDALFDSELPIVDFDNSNFFQQDLTYIIHENQFKLNGFYRHPDSFTQSQIIDFVKNAVNDIFYCHNSLAKFVNNEDIIKTVLPMIPFNTSLMLLANEIVAEHGDEYVGVHLRKTDFCPTFDETIIRDAIVDNPTVKFFICSDDQETENFYKRYHNVFLHNKSHYVEKLIDGNWNSHIVDQLGNSFPFNVNRSQQSVLDAVVDLLLLSRSSILSTDMRSRFLQIAFLLQDSKWWLQHDK